MRTEYSNPYSSSHIIGGQMSLNPSPSANRWAFFRWLRRQVYQGF